MIMDEQIAKLETQLLNWITRSEATGCYQEIQSISSSLEVLEKVRFMRQVSERIDDDFIRFVKAFLRK